MLIQNSCEKHNRDGVSRDSIPQDVVPTHAVWCAPDRVGPKHEIGGPIEDFWFVALLVLAPSRTRRPEYFMFRSEDGATLYLAPVPSRKVVWRGEC